MASAFQHYLTDNQCPLSKAAQPMLILWGLADGSHPDTVRDSARKYTSGAVSVREYADIGHFPELEDVDLIYRDIAAFAGV
jgi:pimeloyl-ACP methyl ester carboxylesterase